MHKFDIYPDPLKRLWQARRNAARDLFVCLSLAAALSACGAAVATDDAAVAGDTGTGDGSPADVAAGQEASTAETGGGDAANPSDISGDSQVAPLGLLTPRSLKIQTSLRGVWGSSPDDFWLVGDKGHIAHNSCKSLAPRSSGTTKDLYAVGGRNASDVVIVGDGVILHWNGVTLSDDTPKLAAGTIFRSVHAPADGSTLVVAGDAGVVLRRNKDGVWSQETTNSVANLQSIYAIGSGQLWAMAELGSALKLNGGVWSPTKMPKATTTLRAVTASPGGRLFAAGDEGYLAATTDGTWEATLANDPDGRDLFGLWAQSDTDCWAIGSKGALLHYVGKKWNLSEIDGTYMKTRSFSALWGTSTKDKGGFAVAVGEAASDNTGKIDTAAGVVYEGGKWNDFKPEMVADLKSISAANSGELYAVGQGGLLLKAADATAPFYDLAVDVSCNDLNDVSAISAVVAVGNGGVVVTAGEVAGKWLVRTAPNGVQLNGVAAVGSDSAVAVGDNGVAIWIGTGINKNSKMVSEATGVQIPLRAIASAGSFTFAVGNYGTVVKRDANGKWSKEDSGGVDDLVRVITWGNGEAMAVSDQGSIALRSEGPSGTWKKVFESPGLFLYGATRRADGTLIAVGWQGALVVGKVGESFKKLAGGVANVLYGVASTSKGTVAVGKKGGVYAVAEKLQ